MARATDRSADAADRAAEAARQSAEIQVREHLRASEIVDVRWQVPQVGRLGVMNVGTTSARTVTVTFEVDGERFLVSRDEVHPGQCVDLPTEDELPEGEIQRRSVLVVAAQHNEIRGFPGGTVFIAYWSPRGTPLSWQGELPADPLLGIW